MSLSELANSSLVKDFANTPQETLESLVKEDPVMRLCVEWCRRVSDQAPLKSDFSQNVPQFPLS
jgi:hypothetical protein